MSIPGSTTNPSEQLGGGVIAAAVIIALVFIGVLVIGVIVLVVVFLRWHKQMATKGDLRTQNDNGITHLTAMATETVSGSSPHKHYADDIEWKTEPQLYSTVHKKPPPSIPNFEVTELHNMEYEDHNLKPVRQTVEPQLYSAVHKEPPPAIPAQNFDMTELEDTLYDDTVLMGSKPLTEEENHSYEHAPNELDIYAEPLKGRRLAPNATFESSEPIYSEALDPTQLFSQDRGAQGGNDLHPYGAIYADPQPLKRSEAPIEITAGNIHELKRLGFGQFGEVVLAETVGVSLKDMKRSYDDDSKNVRIQVAVKKLKPNAQLSVREAFGKEIKFMSRLKDENIVCLLAICTSGSPFIVMEYMENGDLNQYLQKYELATSDSSVILPNQLPSSTLVYMVVQIASGMRYLASLKYVHRDMATRNCLVGQDYMVKIADFGMSRSLYDDSYYRVRGKAMLPIRWMPTESFYGQFSEKTDVWAYGVTMWEVFSLCKQQPYNELNDQEVIQNAIKGTGRQMLPKPEGCLQEIYEMMLRCWEHIPDERADFEEIFSTLSAIQINM